MYYFRCSKKHGMEKIRISAVKYANTYPFIYGLTKSGFYSEAVVETDHPSVCAEKLISGKADLGLIPVAAIPLLKEYHIIGDYCIGTEGRVRTVQIMSDYQLNDVEEIFLDYRSVTSVKLIKVLARNYWKRDFIWTDTYEGFDFSNIGENKAVVLIGDQCFDFEGKYRYTCDLALEWKNFSELPFVFACWVSNKMIPDEFIEKFNHALSLGVNNIDLVVRYFEKNSAITGGELKKYLTQNIDFIFDNRKRRAIDLFLNFLKML
jgi:chorismate dehydratase